MMLLGDQQFPSMINTQTKVASGKGRDGGDTGALTKSKTKTKLFAGKSSESTSNAQRSRSPAIQFPNGIPVPEFEPEVSVILSFSLEC